MKNHAIETLEKRLCRVNKNLETVVTDIMKNEYTEQKEDLELAIHNLKMLNKQ